MSELFRRRTVPHRFLLIVACAAFAVPAALSFDTPAAADATTTETQPDAAPSPGESCSPEAAVTINRVDVGIGGTWKIGKWTPIEVEVTAERPLNATVVVRAVDPDGHPVAFPAKPVQIKAGPNVLHSGFQIGRARSSVSVELYDGDRRLAERSLRVSSDVPGELPRPLELAWVVVAAVGDPAGLPDPPPDDEDERARTRRMERDPLHVVPLDGFEQLPTAAAALEALDVLVVAGSYGLDTDRSRALQRWVENGGHLVLSVGRGVDEYRASPLAEWVPVPVAGQSRLRDLSGLESYSGKSARVPIFERVPAARLGSVEGRRIVSEIDGPVLVRAPLGFGKVTFFALDLDRPPLSRWEPLSDIVRRILTDVRDGSGARSAGRAGQLAHTGITDLATQLHAAQDHFPQVRRLSSWTVMGLIVVWLLLIGPLDYLVVHKLLRRPHLTWVTFPVFVLAAGAAAVWSAGTHNGQRLYVNQVDLLDIDAGSNLVRGRSWATLYSPETRRYDLSLVPLQQEWSVPGGDEGGNPDVRLSWSGIPETAFGGMYRSGGLEVTRPGYRLVSELTSLEDVPVSVWSTKSITAAWNGHGGPLVESRLESPSPSTLSGTITHRLPVPIEDAVLAFEDRVYWLRPVGRDGRAAIPPHQPWSPDDPNVYRRELSGYLTRTVDTRIRRDKLRDEILETKTPWDPLGREPEDIIRMMTFHRAAGGEAYTGLEHNALREFDLSELLKLDRAVLFGRIDTRAAGLQIDGEGVEPHRQATYVRIVLPVRPRGPGDSPVPAWQRQDGS